MAWQFRQSLKLDQQQKERHGIFSLLPARAYCARFDGQPCQERAVAQPWRTWRACHAQQHRHPQDSRPARFRLLLHLKAGLAQRCTHRSRAHQRNRGAACPSFRLVGSGRNPGDDSGNCRNGCCDGSGHSADLRGRGRLKAPPFAVLSPRAQSFRRKNASAPHLPAHSKLRRTFVRFPERVGDSLLTGVPGFRHRREFQPIDADEECSVSPSEAPWLVPNFQITKCSSKKTNGGNRIESGLHRLRLPKFPEITNSLNRTTEASRVQNPDLWGLNFSLTLYPALHLLAARRRQSNCNRWSSRSSCSGSSFHSAP